VANPHTEEKDPDQHDSKPRQAPLPTTFIYAILAGVQEARCNVAQRVIGDKQKGAPNYLPAAFYPGCLSRR